MGRIDYLEMKNIFNIKIFENSRIDLIEKLSKSPNRYIGLFRPTKPFTKIVQNITQSHEIKFGDAFELLIRKCFEINGYVSLERRIQIEDQSFLNLDQLFQFRDKIVFIEQKVRDDHDSTKKRGQINNFEKKINYLIEKHGNENIKCYFYFIDDSFKKNKRSYLKEINKLKDFYEIDINLCYGEELFIHEKLNDLWEEEIINFLIKWRAELPDMPEVNFDKYPQETFDELKNLSIPILRKLLDNEELIEVIFPIIFPENKTLNLLKIHYENLSKTKHTKSLIYKKISEKLTTIIQNN